jgi:hypothetical protein
MRKKLMLTVDGYNLYGTDENNKVVLSPEDFRSTVSKSIALGTFQEGDYFEIEVDAEGHPIRRPVDNTVAIHVPIEKRYSKRDVINIIREVHDDAKANVIKDIESYL